MQAPPFDALMRERLQRLALSEEAITQIRSATYAFCLKLCDGRVFQAALKSAGLDTQDNREYKEWVVFNHYARALLWRAVYLYVTGTSFKRLRTAYGVHRQDIKQAIKSLTADQYVQVLTAASRESVYCIPEEDIRWLVQRSMPICRSIAYRKLRFIERYDPAFDGARELMLEAIRIIYHYSHFPRRARILGNVRTSVSRYAKRLIEWNQAEQRRRVEAVPIFRCRSCSSAFEVEKQLLRASDLAERRIAIPLNLMGSDNRFCAKCAQKRKIAVRLDPIESDRAYMTTTASLDVEIGDNGSGSDVPQGTLGSRIADDTLPIDEQVAEKEYVETLTKKLSKIDQRFLHILLEGDEDFNHWLLKRSVRAVNDPGTLAHLICEFLGIRYLDVQDRIGRILSPPKPYLVQTGEEEDEDRSRDIVFARNAKDAVAFVAKAYRFPDGRAMQAACGRVRVRPYYEMDTTLAVNEGHVIPL